MSFKLTIKKMLTGGMVIEKDSINTIEYANSKCAGIY